MLASTPLTNTRSSSDSKFNTSFFQSHVARRTITITNHLGNPRTYTFPTFFTGTRSSMAAFAVREDVARDLISDTSLHPVRVWKNTCLLMIACFDYGFISDNMAPYREVGIGIAVSNSKVPILPALLRSHMPSFGLWILDLPVDSKENCHRGIEIWNLPKSMKQIDFQDDHRSRIVTIRENGATCMRLELPLGGRRRPIQELNRVYSRKNGSVLISETHAQGECEEYFRWSPRIRETSITFGTQSPYSQFAQLEPKGPPLLVRNFDNLSTALYLPK